MLAKGLIAEKSRENVKKTPAANPDIAGSAHHAVRTLHKSLRE